jgi:hypothetical protein
MTFGFRRFGFDLDNTIIDYGISVEKYCLNAKIPKQEKITSLRSYLRKIDPSDLKWQEAQSWIYIDGLQYAKLNEGIVDLCVYLLSKNIGVFIVSHKTNKTQDRFGGRDLFSPAVNWIQHSNIKNFFDINENIYFMPTRDAKIQKIEQLDLNWFVDDLLEVLLDKNFPPHTTKYLLADEEIPELSANIDVVGNFSLIKEKLTL